MVFEPVLPEQREAYNAVVSHPLQSYEWGEFREKSGVKVVRRGLWEGKKLVSGFQLTIHPIPRTNFTIGYLPKSDLPSREVLKELEKIGKEHNCIFIQLEPNSIAHRHSGDDQREDSRISRGGVSVRDSGKSLIPLEGAGMTELGLIPSAHPLFTKYTFIMDLTKSEDAILKGMHQKTRYNIKVALKHDVKVAEENTGEAFQRYWELTEETTKRQKFYAHTKQYHKLQWETFPHTNGSNQLTSHLLTATVEKKILTTMLFFVFHDTLYYPYGASSNEARNTMHSVLTMWEGIKFGKKLGLKQFDMWGSLSENPDQSDPWFGFHRFKQGFGPDLVEFVGSYDLVLNPFAYQGYKVADKLRWAYLKLKK